MAQLSYFFALGANLCFASATLVFTHFSHRTNVYWVNLFKALVASLACLITLFFIGPLEWSWGQSYFFLSGVIGLMIGDIFLLKAFTSLGPGRSLVLFGFHPLFVGMIAFYLFGQKIDSTQWTSMFFLLACLITFSLENKRMYKTWGIKGLFYALIGVSLDAIGMIATKYGFELTNSHFIQAHMIRSMGAVLGFLVLGVVLGIPYIKVYNGLLGREKVFILLASFCGTFLSLSLYMAAIQYGHLATISAIAITTPFIASALECIHKKKWPSKYFLLAFLFFIIGFYLLIAPAFA